LSPFFFFKTDPRLIFSVHMLGIKVDSTWIKCRIAGGKQ
jgi:hypothetical protein